ncbi:hypothetical protein ACOMHN_033138 [Nucella lapillus]
MNSLVCANQGQLIYRLNGDHWGHYYNGASQGESSLAYQKDVTAFSNPFFLRLSSAARSSLSDGVQVEVSCLEPCVVHVYWGAEISPVHAALLKTGTRLLEDMGSNGLLAGDCLATERHRLDREGKHSLRLSVPEEVSADTLGPSPRRRYPCVLVMATTANRSATIERTSVVAMVSILHLKDSECCMGTHVIAQYAKMAGLAVYNLQPLFFASDLEEVSGDASSPDDNTSRSQPTTEAGVEDTQTADTAQPVSTSVSGVSGNRGDSDDRESAPESSSCPGDGEPVTAHDSYCRRQDSARENALPECIVCQSRALNCALLPCRHTCVCRACFHKLDRCPMCRSHIESYFTLRDEDDDDDNIIGMGSGSDEPVPLDLYGRFERFNQRLNRLLGFE